MKKIFVLSNLMFITFLCTACGPKVPNEVSFDVNDLPTMVEIHTEAQKELLEAEDPVAFNSSHFNQFGKESNSAPQAYSLTWNITSDNGALPNKYVVSFDDGQDKLVFETKTNSCNITNLKCDTSYTYNISAYFGKTVFTSENYTLATSKSAPRNIYIEGMENVRDLGGWDIGEGKTYKQGLIYRTAELNGDEKGVSKPTEEGKRVLLDNLKIKCEIDLRKTVKTFHKDEVCGITSSPLGDSVKYVSCPMEFNNKNIFTNEDNVESIKSFFDTLSDVNNYPMVFHCVRGTDRTGALAYAIGAMCGMNETDLMRDYLFSNFANLGGKGVNPADTIDGILTDTFYVKGIQNAEGTTLSEKAMNYLNSNIGVSKETLNKIVDILVD